MNKEVDREITFLYITNLYISSAQAGEDDTSILASASITSLRVSNTLKLARENGGVFSVIQTIIFVI
jgi:hypothetical protein